MSIPATAAFGPARPTYPQRAAASAVTASWMGKLSDMTIPRAAAVATEIAVSPIPLSRSSMSPFGSQTPASTAPIARGNATWPPTSLTAAKARAPVIRATLSGPSQRVAAQSVSIDDRRTLR